MVAERVAHCVAEPRTSAHILLPPEQGFCVGPARYNNHMNTQANGRGTVPRILLISGPLGSGKGYAAREVLRACDERGLRCLLVDLDQVSREVFARSTHVVGAVEERCGRGVVCEGRIDRSALADRVFADPAELRWLESVTHPAIARSLESTIVAASDEGYDYVVVETPLPLESSSARAEFDRILAGATRVSIDANPELRAALAVLRGDAEMDAERRIAAQPAQQLYNAGADVVVVNTGDPDAFLATVRDKVVPLLDLD